MNPKTQPDTSALEILKAELGESRMKILEDNNLVMLVQWAMIQYHDVKTALFEVKRQYSLNQEDYGRFIKWAFDNKLCTEVSLVRSTPIIWECRAYRKLGMDGKNCTMPEKKERNLLSFWIKNKKYGN